MRGIRPWARWPPSEASIRGPGGWSTGSFRDGRSLSRACSTGMSANRWSSIARWSIAWTYGSSASRGPIARSTSSGSRVAAGEFDDLRSHWDQWRVEWEHKLERNEIQFLRSSAADLQGAFQHRANLMDANYRDAVRAQHQDFTVALERNGNEIQKRLWADLERARLEYERLIYAELKIIRQRAAGWPVPAEQSRDLQGGGGPATTLRLRPLRRALPRLRGVRQSRPAGLPAVFPELQRRAGSRLRARRIPGNDAPGRSACARHRPERRIRGPLPAQGAGRRDCRPLRVPRGPAEAALDGIFCSQVVEHIPPERLPELIGCRLPPRAQRSHRHRDAQSGVPRHLCLALLPRPDARAAGAPSAAGLLSGGVWVGNVEVRRLSPAVESMPSLGSLPKISARRSSEP